MLAIIGDIVRFSDDRGAAKEFGRYGEIIGLTGNGGIVIKTTDKNVGWERNIYGQFPCIDIIGHNFGAEITLYTLDNAE